jgi:hypothetical protein
MPTGVQGQPHPEASGSVDTPSNGDDVIEGEVRE